MSKTFIISDTHFGHIGIIKLCNRPFATVEDMNLTMIKNWNSVVAPNDRVFHLGDFAYRAEVGKMMTYFGQLNGKKYLIKGNHDSEETFGLPWEEIYDYKELFVEKRRIVLFHYPIWEWHGFYRDSIHLYGHIHTSDMAKNYSEINVNPELHGSRYIDIGGRSVNMCVEHHNYTPQDVRDIIKRLE